MKQPNKAQKTKKVDSSNTAQSQNADSSPESTFETTPPSSRDDTAHSPSLRADEIGVAIHKQQKQKGEKVDSRSNKSAKSATILSKQAKDSRICDEKSGFSSDWQGSYLSGNDRRQSRRIHDLSRKAESTSKKPTPEPSQAQSSSPKQTTSTDILTCLANLSSDEVFTPPKLVNAMLDLLPQELFSDPSATFLDPASKSGVFLREIARRLMLGLESAIPDPRKRVAHILSRQLFGIATTEMTAILSRRTLYGSKDTDNPTYSIPYKVGAALPQGGNLYYDKHTPHSFKKGKCTYCGASQSQYDRDSSLESYAYAFIHELEPLEEFFTRAKVDSSDTAPSPSSRAEATLSPSSRALRQQGVAIHKSTQVDSPVIANEVKQSTNSTQMDCHAANAARNDSKTATTHNDSETNPQGIPMAFDVIITNPPYQLITGKEASNNAVPIYNRFIQRAKELNPKHIVFIIPSRWMVGGIGLDSFRQEMINDPHIKTIIDYEDSKACFPDNNIDGGICILHREQAYTGKIDYTFISTNGTTHTSKRTLHNPYSKFIIRNGAVLEILDKILASTQDKFSSIVSSISPFGIPTFLFNEPERFPNANLQDTPFLHSVKIYGVKGHKGGGPKRVSGYVLESLATSNTELIPKYKIFFSKAYSTDAIHYPEPILAKPNEICTATFLSIGSFTSESEQANCYSYMQTKFFKFLLLLIRGSMNVSQESFALVPLQDFSQAWSDEMLYKKYGISDDEIAYIESRIKGM